MPNDREGHELWHAGDRVVLEAAAEYVGTIRTMMQGVPMALVVPNLHMRAAEKSPAYARILTREVSDPYNLTMVCRVNGEEWGRGSTSTMFWKFEDLLAHISQSETLHPGEFFGSGTVGNGCGLEHMKTLKHGDVVELEVEGIGILRNRVLTPA